MTCLQHESLSTSFKALYILACLPHRCVKKYTGCIINGVRFLIKERDSRRRSQHSGTVVKGNHGDEIIDFYGELNEIIQPDYMKDRCVILFKCEWFDLGNRKSGVQKDGNITSVKVIGKWYQNDYYVLADQVKQVFYISDTKLGNDWRVVQPFQHRHIYDVDEMQNKDMEDSDLHFIEDEVYQDNEVNNYGHVDMSEIPSLNRNDIDPEDMKLLIIMNIPEYIENENIMVDVDESDEEDDIIIDCCCSDEDNCNINDNDEDDDD